MTALFDLAVRGAGQMPFGSTLNATARVLMTAVTRVVPTKVAFACDPYNCVRNCSVCGCPTGPYCCNNCVAPEQPCC